MKLFLVVQKSIKHFSIPLRKSLKVIAEGDFLDSKGLCAEESDIISYTITKRKRAKYKPFRPFLKQNYPSELARSCTLCICGKNSTSAHSKTLSTRSGTVLRSRSYAIAVSS